MSPARKSPRRLAALEWVAVIVLGGLIGSALAGLVGALLGDGPVLGALTRTWAIGLNPPATLDLKVMTFTFGATLHVGLLTVVGAAAALWLYLRIR